MRNGKISNHLESDEDTRTNPTPHHLSLSQSNSILLVKEIIIPVQIIDPTVYKPHTEPSRFRTRSLKYRPFPSRLHKSQIKTRRAIFFPSKLKLFEIDFSVREVEIVREYGCER